MSYTRLDSSHVDGAEYDAAMAQLHVRFHSGAEWTYHGVPQSAADDLMSAPSPGRHMHTIIKPNYRATRR